MFYNIFFRDLDLIINQNNTYSPRYFKPIMQIDKFNLVTFDDI